MNIATRPPGITVTYYSWNPKLRSSGVQTTAISCFEPLSGARAGKRGDTSDGWRSGRQIEFSRVEFDLALSRGG